MSIFMFPSRQFVPYGRVNRHFVHSDPFDEIFDDLMPWYDQCSYLRPADYVYHPLHGTVCPRRPKPLRETTPWVHVVALPGFEPSDINITVEGAKVAVHARRKIQQGDDNYDVMEVRRSVRVPEGVDKIKVRSFLRQNGDLVLTAPYANVKEEEKERKSRSADEPQPHKQQRVLKPMSLSDLIATILLGKNETSTQQENQPANAERQNETSVAKRVTHKPGRQNSEVTRPVRKQIPVQIMAERLDSVKTETPVEGKLEETKQTESELTAESVVADVKPDGLIVDQNDVSEALLRPFGMVEQGTNNPDEHEVTEDRMTTEDSSLGPDHKPENEDGKTEAEGSKPDSAIVGPRETEVNTNAAELVSSDDNAKLIKDDS